MTQNIELGRQYEDTMHGVRGIATSLCHYLTGCSRVCLERMVEGKVEDHWIDITRAKLIEDAPVYKPAEHLPVATPDPGGPGKTPPSRNPR